MKFWCVQKEVLSVVVENWIGLKPFSKSTKAPSGHENYLIFNVSENISVDPCVFHSKQKRRSVTAFSDLLITAVK